ncbi:dipeptide epimerase [Hufsiella ginkgonis]|uniref:Dipeptide epimerase n=1 Tax=Hufsiella ginkgonis TaxID=2695274 RepID=A0A7K1XTE6_9SPHI|nr:dipeptide epimerase [Hufsiella ginkgonis]MXV14200.1 dipeptide epimerase [Hufsiella ginkgonis]
MKLSFSPFELELKYPFTISRFSRTSTPIMLVKLSHEGCTGLGEASMVPYMGENMETATGFLNKIDLSAIKYPFDHAEINAYLDSIAPGNPAVKAAVDIACYDLRGKLENKPCYTYFDADPANMPVTSITIGIDTPELVLKKVHDAEAGKVIKIKLGRDNDEELIRTIRQATDKPLYADANQGWMDPQEGLDKVYWLQEQGVVLIEQPMARDNRDGNAWITARSPIPIIGDEAVQRLGDVTAASGIYHGINMKLMKSGGLYEGHLMIKKATELGMQVLIGCMSETSIGTLAGAALAPLCHWADLDGPFLTSNNPYPAPPFSEGKWELSAAPGLGVAENSPKT